MRYNIYMLICASTTQNITSKPEIVKPSKNILSSIKNVILNFFYILFFKYIKYIYNFYLLIYAYINQLLIIYTRYLPMVCTSIILILSILCIMHHFVTQNGVNKDDKSSILFDLKKILHFNDNQDDDKFIICISWIYWIFMYCIYYILYIPVTILNLFSLCVLNIPNINNKLDTMIKNYPTLKFLSIPLIFILTIIYIVFFVIATYLVLVLIVQFRLLQPLFNIILKFFIRKCKIYNIILILIIHLILTLICIGVMFVASLIFLKLFFDINKYNEYLKATTDKLGDIWTSNEEWDLKILTYIYYLLIYPMKFIITDIIWNMIICIKFYSYIYDAKDDKLSYNYGDKWWKNIFTGFMRAFIIILLLLYSLITLKTIRFLQKQYKNYKLKQFTYPYEEIKFKGLEDKIIKPHDD